MAYIAPTVASMNWFVDSPPGSHTWFPCPDWPGCLAMSEGSAAEGGGLFPRSPNGTIIRAFQKALFNPFEINIFV